MSNFNLRISHLQVVSNPRHQTCALTILDLVHTGTCKREQAKSTHGSMIHKPIWEARAVKSYSMAELEARKLKYSTTGTEALVMGILTEGTSAAAKFLRKNGITLFGIRDETVKLLGKADMYFFSPEHPPLTQPAQDALDWALDEKSRLGIDGEVSTTLLLLGIWAQKGSAGQTILSSLGFDDKMATELTASLKKEKEMVSAASS
ncbi:unnamed protein product [Sphagnum jensenii]|uniref:Clp R domain-containing protein n=1 Tax=Sphagnum jensenii TaxID=128206 RepID=A0ABP0W0M4_9BRYO